MNRDHTYNAFIAAFSLVSYSDGVLHTAELYRFTKILAEDSDFKDLNAYDLMYDILTFGKSLKSDLVKGKAEGLQIIAKMKNNRDIADKIMKIAQMTIVSDNKVSETEEGVMDEISKALGLSE